MKKLLVTSLLLSSASVFAAPFTVQDIRVEGTDPVTAENIIAGLPVKVGQRATDQDLSQIVRSLFLRGSYENVEAVREGNALVLRIQARPYITSLEISGNKQIPKDALETNLRDNGIAKGEILDKNKEYLINIGEIVEQQTASTEKTLAAANELSNLAEELKTLIDKFDV